MSAAVRVARTAAWSVGTQVVTLVSQIAMVPLFLRRWGAETYGDWLSLSAVTGYLVLADAGMQGYVLNRIAGLASQDRWDEAARAFSSALATYAVLVGGALAVAVGGSLAWPWAASFAGRAMASEAVGVALFLSVQAAAAVAAGFVGGTYRAAGRLDLSQAASFLGKLMLLCATALVVLAGARPAAVAAAQMTVMLVMLAGTTWDVRRRLPRFDWSIAKADRRLALSFLGPSLLYLLFPLANALALQGTVLAVAKVAGAVAVVTLATSRTVANTLRQLASLVSMSAWGELTRLDATGQREALARSHRLLAKLSSVGAAAAGAWLFVAGPSLYALWTGGKSVPDVALMRLLLVDNVLSMPAWTSMILLAATNRYASVAWLQVAIGVAQVAVAAALVPTGGLWTLGAASIALNSGVQTLLVPRWVAEATGEGPRSFLRRVMLPLVATFAVLLAVALGTWALPLPGVARLAVSGLAVAGAALAAMRAGAMDPDERARLAALLVRLVARVRRASPAR